MATSPLSQEGASAPSNVVKFPNSAPRKVRQPWSRAERAQRESLLQFPGEFVFPAIREQMDDAQRIRETERTPAFMLAWAMFEALDDDTRRIARLLLSGMTCSKDDEAGAAAADALAFVKERTHGERNDLNQALKRLRDWRA